MAESRVGVIHMHCARIKVIPVKNHLDLEAHKYHFLKDTNDKIKQFLIVLLTNLSLWQILIANPTSTCELVFSMFELKYWLCAPDVLGDFSRYDLGLRRYIDGCAAAIMHRFILRPPVQGVITPRIIRAMSTNSSYSNLPENVRELVSGTHISESHTEPPEAEKKEIASWVAKASDASFASQSTIPVCVLESNINGMCA
jgi:hypothetical protein